MKKIIAFLMCVILLFACVGCNKGDNVAELSELSANQVLVVGSKVFRNYIDEEEEEDVYLEYVSDITYTLKRSSYNNYDESYVLYNGYYYYWSINESKIQSKIGTKKVTNTYKYSYLALGADNQNVLVKTTQKTVLEYSYSGGIIEKPFELYTYLNNYFTSLTDLKEKCIELYNKLDQSPTKKYHVSANDITEITYNVKTYNNYFYIERV